MVTAFPKIFHIGDGMIPNLFKGEVEITEKVDGSQWDFGIDENDEINMRSHKQDLSVCPVPKMFEIAETQVQRIVSKLSEEAEGLKDIYFYCEFLNKPHHNVLTYQRVPKNNLYLFGVQLNGELISEYRYLVEWANKLDIEPPNVLFHGVITPEDIERFLEKESVLGGTKIEGVVVKNYNEPAFRGSYVLPISMGKYVSEKFKEKHNKDWKREHTGKGKLELLIESFKTEARWQKAVQHLRDNDELEHAPKDIGKLIKEIQRDLEEEERTYIEQRLYQIFIGDICRTAKRGFPEWYKKKLLEGLELND